DPELKQGVKGPYLKMRLATEHSWKNKESNARESRTEWHSLTMFGPRTEALARYLHKGSRVFVKGHLQTSNYEKEGQKHYKTDVIVDDLYFAGNVGHSNGAYASAPREPALTASEAPF